MRKVKLKLKVPKNLVNAGDKKAIKLRRESEIKSREADMEIAENIPWSSKDKIKKYRDENKKYISDKQMKEYQDTVARFYSRYVVLNDEQKEELAMLLPSTLYTAKGQLNVRVGTHAIFPHVLDSKRKKIKKAKASNEARKLRYIESDERRGLHVSDEETEKVFNKSISPKQAKMNMIRTLISISYADHEICEHLGIRGHELAKLKKEIFYEEITSQRDMTGEELFAQYKLQQLEIVKDIDVLVERFKDSQQLTAMASILKTKADIYDKIIEKGQEFGVIKKTPDKIMMGALVFSDMSTKELKDVSNKMNDDIKKLMNNNDSFLDESNAIGVEIEEDNEFK